MFNFIAVHREEEYTDNGLEIAEGENASIYVCCEKANTESKTRRLSRIIKSKWVVGGVCYGY